MTRLQAAWIEKFGSMAPIAWSLAALMLLCGSTCNSANAAKGTAFMPSDGNISRPAPIQAPPMGWSSWNNFSNTVDSEVIVEQAKAIVVSGLKAKGYDYINVDEGWWLGGRDQHGNIVVDPKQWPALGSNERPGDMSNIVHYIHSLGLKAGIYTDVGKGGCSTWWPDLGPLRPNTGSEGHYDQDFLQFAKWGFDYVKVDWCGGFQEKLVPTTQYTQIAHSIRKAEAATGHHLFYSICDWGNDHPWTWAPGIGGVTADIWRTSGDIVAPIVANSPNSGRTVDFSKVLSNFDKGIHPEAEHTGYYNDPDMLVVGMRGMSELQNRVQMSLWSISAAPLLIGADIRELDKTTFAILMNPDVIAVDQDSLGLQGVKISQVNPGLEVIAKRLAGRGRRAVVLFNKTPSSALMSIAWSALGLKPSAPVQVWDVWSHKDRGIYASSYTATIPASDVVMIVLTGTEGKKTWYKPTLLTANSSQAFAFTGVKSGRGLRAIQIAYTNKTAETHIVGLAVNGQFETKIAFPPTGKGKEKGFVTIEASLSSSAKGNMLSFTDLGSKGIALSSITVLAGSL